MRSPMVVSRFGWLSLMAWVALSGCAGADPASDPGPASTSSPDASTPGPDADGGTPCVATTCLAQGKNCGDLIDGCGGTLSCGACGAGQTCGGSGTDHVCGAPARAIERVMVIMMENHGSGQIYGSADAPYINELLTRYGSANQFADVLPTAPSEPHYVWLEAGTNAFSDLTFLTDDDASEKNSTQSPAHLTALLGKKGVSWVAYQEGMEAGTCPISGGALSAYAPKHNPFVFFRDVSGSPPDPKNVFCSAHMKPYSELSKDLAGGGLPAYSLITPDQCHDMHGHLTCPLQLFDSQRIKAGDGWLKQELPALITYAAANKGLILLTWDEPQGSSGFQPFVVIGPGVKPGYASEVPLDLSSVLKSLQTVLKVGPADGEAFLGHAADRGVNDLADFFQPGAYP